MNILFPADFSKNSEVALQYAVDFIKNINGKLTLLHIYEVQAMETPGIGSLSNFSSGPGERLQKRIEEDKEKEVTTKLNELADWHGLKEGDFEILAIRGHVKNEIDKVLSTGDYDLVVLGTRDEKTQRGVFFGGIANHLVSTGKCPVLAIPPNTKYREVKHIVYTTDLVHEEKNILKWLVNYARIHQSTIHLLHIGDDTDKYKISMIHDLIEELPYDHINYEIIPGVEISNVILEISKREKVDMISMTTHTTSLFDKIFHSSFTTDVLGGITVPFLGFSDKDVLPFNFK